MNNKINVRAEGNKILFYREGEDDWFFGTRIENEKDLPKEKGLKCLCLCGHGNTTYISDDVLEDPKWFANKYSHWRLKYEIKDPIY